MTNTEKNNEICYFKVNFNNINTVEDVKEILKYLDLTFNDNGQPERIDPIRHLFVQINS